MITEEFILITEVCKHYKVKEEFIFALHERELLHLEIKEKKTYLISEEMKNFERLCRLHNDLNINVEGLSAVQNLLDKLKRLQDDNRLLRNRLRRYE